MSLDTHKTDSHLGLEINKVLVAKGVETPFTKSPLDKHKKIIAIGEKFAEIMQLLGLDLSDDSLSETPSRVAKMFVRETLWGLDYDNFPRIMTIANKMNSAMVVERSIKVVSMCEHHFVPIIGKAHIAYIPNNKVIGLSKLNRVVEFFSRRPQVQERLVEQIYYCLSHILGTKNIAITIVADHYCVKSRGVEDHSSDTVTTRLGGFFYDDHDVRNEFYEAIKL